MNGGRSDPECSDVSDNFIVNLGEPAFWGQEPPHPSELKKWHCDGNVSTFSCNALMAVLCPRETCLTKLISVP